MWYSRPPSLLCTLLSTFFKQVSSKTTLKVSYIWSLVIYYSVDQSSNCNGEDVLTRKSHSEKPELLWLDRVDELHVPIDLAAGSLLSGTNRSVTSNDSKWTTGGRSGVQNVGVKGKEGDERIRSLGSRKRR